MLDEERDSDQRRFGVSTHLFHGDRLSRDHLVEIAAHDFDVVELFATRSHFDYHDAGAIESLAEWLEDTRLTVHSLHAPISASLIEGVWGESYSTAAADGARRQRALSEIEAALRVARRIPYRFLVVHLGIPGHDVAGDNHLDAARRSIEAVHEKASEVGVRLALEVIPNALSAPDSLVRLIEDDLELDGIGICLDVGHAFMMGDAVEAVETCSGHLWTTHLHDNQGRSDDHLVPYDGGIDWDGVLLALQKIGYDGAWMFEVANTGAPHAVLDRASRARRRFEDALAFDAPFTDDSH